MIFGHLAISQFNHLFRILKHYFYSIKEQLKKFILNIYSSVREDP